MTKFMLVATIAALSIASPGGLAWAQAAISEPGAYAFYHPDGDVLHAGPSQYGAHAEAYGATGARNAMAAVTHPAYRHKQRRAH